MSELHGPDPAFSLWPAAIGLAAFIYGFGSGGRRDSDFRVVAHLFGLAGAVIFIAGLASLAPFAPTEV